MAGHDEGLGQSQLMVVHVDGDLYREEARVVALMTGTAIAPSATVRALSCHNSLSWLADVTLDNHILVSTDPSMIRAAQLVGQGLVDRDLAVAVEAEYWRAGRLPVGSEPSLQDLDLQAVTDYLGRRRESSRLDEARYGVYAVANSTYDFSIVYVDLARFRPESFASVIAQLRSFSPIVAGRGTVDFSAEACAELVE